MWFLGTHRKSILILFLVLLQTSLSNRVRGQAFSEFLIPSPNSGPWGITAGPDGNVWFCEAAHGANNIGRITPAGSITEFPIPTANSGPNGITAGPDGNLWFTESAGKIGRISPAGVTTEFPIPTYSSGAYGITAGPDGNLWFTESAGKIGRITTAGATQPRERSEPTGASRAGRNAETIPRPSRPHWQGSPLVPGFGVALGVRRGVGGENSVPLFVPPPGQRP